MHVLLASFDDPTDPHAWSGTPHAVLTQLQRRFERVSVLHYAPPRRTPLHLALRLLCGGKPPWWQIWLTPPALRRFGDELKQAVERHQPDVLLSISSQGLAYYQPDVPNYMLTDAPWIAWMQAYKGYWRKPVNSANFVAREAKAAKNLAGLVVCSDWARDEAQRLYGIDAARAHVLPFGANWAPTTSEEALRAAVRERASDRLELLFVGRDWLRKGGDIAVEVTRRLNGAGVLARLNIVGCDPPLSDADRQWVQIHGFLDRTRPEQAARLAELFASSHLLLMPTRAECYGLSYCEAAAFALPAVSYAVHGVPTIIDDDRTGLLFAPGTDASAMAARIATLFADRSRYLAMCDDARARYRERLNWDAFGDALETLLRSGAAKAGGQP